MADERNRFTVRPTGRALARLRKIVDDLMTEGEVASETAAVTYVLVKGLDAIEAKGAAGSDGA